MHCQEDVGVICIILSQKYNKLKYFVAKEFYFAYFMQIHLLSFTTFNCLTVVS